MTTKSQGVRTSPHNSNGAAAPISSNDEATFADKLPGTFSPHRWYSDSAAELQFRGSGVMQLAGRVYSIAGGVEVLLEILEQDNVSVEAGEATYLSRYFRSRLERLAITSLALLREESEQFMAGAESAARTKERS